MTDEGYSSKGHNHMSLSDTAGIAVEKIDLFVGLDSKDLEVIDKYLVCRHMPEGAILFEEGQAGDSLYIVRRGFVRILKDLEGVQTELALRREGEMFGEMGLIDSSPRFATAVCGAESEVLMLSRERFLEIIRDHPAIATHILYLLASRTREMDNAHLHKLETKSQDLGTAHVRLEQLLEQLSRSNERLEAALTFRDRVLAVSPYPAIVTDSKNQIRLINPTAMRLFGQVNSSDLWSWLTPTNFDDITPIETALQCGTAWKGELEIGNEQRQTSICKLVVAPISDTGEGDAARVWIFEDLTEIRFLEQQALQREQLATKGEMAAEIAHELNNFLAVLSGNAELLSMQLGDSANEALQKRLDGMSTTIERIRVFTDNMLNSRHPGGERIDVDINQFLENQIAFLKPQKRIKRTIIKTEWGSDVPSLNCDPSAIQQVFYNLMLNAADALSEADATHNTVTVRTSYDKSAEAVSIVVADDGPGIPEHLIGSVFQERVSSKPSGHGFGLLTIARLVQEHGGTVRGINSPEGGAEFTVVLPLNPSNA